MTAKKLTIATMTDEDFDWLVSARDTQLWRILDASMAPEFLPGDVLDVSLRVVPETGDLVVACLADGTAVMGSYKARRGKKAFDVIPADKRRPAARINAKSPGELLGVAFMPPSQDADLREAALCLE